MEFLVLLLGFAIGTLIVNKVAGSVQEQIKEPCKSHKWDWVDQPGTFDEDGKPVQYLFCSKCQKSANQIMFEE